MTQRLYDFLAQDHNRLDQLLLEATAQAGAINRDPYDKFRKGLLRHIGIEERIVMPAIARLQNGKQAEVAERLRLDHGAIAALLVPPPSATIIATLRSILEKHNALEEEEGGLYLLLNRLASNEENGLLEKMSNTPEVPVMPYNEKPSVLEATQRALKRAGYEFLNVSG
ncbi:MAG: hemerythrin domain-containing protein [bacterium]